MRQVGKVITLESVSSQGQAERPGAGEAASYIIGLDYGTESARGVLIDVATGAQVAHRVHSYRHGVMTTALANGLPLPDGWALQDAADYVEAAQDILAALGRGKEIASIGIGFPPARRCRRMQLARLCRSINRTSRMPM